ncbi:sodium:proton antiporter [Aequorivita soesokkakensis]|uniref:Sodium:proton antiporter n=1 Tax=Aequorivita soesokkakensis TaxID=1385699 RepID=A0A1A9LER6_9FLAO|nr:sodium:proton antiporter [Aequorivita soesokkakensis]
MLVWSVFEISLPLTNPVIKFLLILAIILFAPIVLNKIKIPPLLGLIIAGAIIGPHGFNLMERDSSIILSGTAGLLYIMFLAGLEIDLADFKKNSSKSFVFGMYTFLVPMGLGILAGGWILELSWASTILLASMFASHTLIAYPLISKLGVAKNRAVNITVGGTMITDTLALLVLAIIVGMTTGEVNTEFWIRLSISILLFGLIVIVFFPIIGRWFFKRFEDSVSQYIFVLMMVFLGAVLAELAGIEAIIGAFLAGLTLNRLIPHTSPLMNRIEFVGNAIFIPFFLIGVGMLIDYSVFFKDWETIKVGAVMIVVATLAKFIAAWLTQKTYKLSVDERSIIFGLSNAQAAATLAAVLVGYSIVIGETPTGEPIRLLGENILNGTILMILFTCTIASFVAQRGAKNIALAEAYGTLDNEYLLEEKILIPINNIENTDELVNLGVIIKSSKNKDGLYALNIIYNQYNDGSADKIANKILTRATVTASATDTILHGLLRYDLNIVNGIISVVKERKITDLILGLHESKGISDSFLGQLSEGILSKCDTTTLIYKSVQPLATIKRHVVIVPSRAEKEIGFPYWLVKLWNIAKNSGAKLSFYATEETLKFIKDIHLKYPIEAQFTECDNWLEFLKLSQEFHKDDNIIVVLSRKNNPSYQNSMVEIPKYLNERFKQNSFIIIYPLQERETDRNGIDLTDATIKQPLEKLDEIGKAIAKIFRQ